MQVEMYGRGMQQEDKKSEEKTRKNVQSDEK